MQHNKFANVCSVYTSNYKYGKTLFTTLRFDPMVTSKTSHLHSEIGLLHTSRLVFHSTMFKTTIAEIGGGLWEI